MCLSVVFTIARLAFDELCIPCFVHAMFAKRHMIFSAFHDNLSCHVQILNVLVMHLTNINELKFLARFILAHCLPYEQHPLRFFQKYSGTLDVTIAKLP